jgi:antirestriction protein
MNATQDREMTQTEAELFAEIEEAGHDIEAVQAYRANMGEQYTPLSDGRDWIDQFEEAYIGEMSTREFAEQLADETLLSDPSISQWLVTYFDYEKFERDLFMGDYWENKGYIFRSI